MRKSIKRYSDNELLKLKEKKSYLEIALLFGMSQSGVYKEFINRDILNKRYNPLIELSDQELIELRNKRYTYEEIGSKYGLSSNTVRKEYIDRGIIDETIVRKRLLEDIPDSELGYLRLKYKTIKSLSEHLCVSESAINRELARRKLTKGDMLKTVIKDLRLDGYTYEEIAEKLDVGISTIYRNKD